MRKLSIKSLYGAGLLFIFTWVLLQSCSYEQLVGWLSKHYALSHTQSQKLQELFPPWRWHAAQLFIAAGTSLLLGTLPYACRKSRELGCSLYIELQSILIFYKKSLQARVVVLLLPLFTGIWYAFEVARFPLPHIDEAFGYVHLIRRGLLVCLTYYPGPNHHVLYNLCAALLDKFLPAFWAIKLPSLLAVIALGMLLTDTALRRWKLPPFLAALLLIAFHGIEGVMVYAGLGRAYVLHCFWVAFALRLLPALEHSVLARRLFVGVNSLAFYTLPTHIYAWLALAVACAWGYGFRQWWLVRLHLQVVFLTALLYAPFVLTQGWLFWQSPFIASMKSAAWFRWFPAYLWSVMLFLFGNPFVPVLWGIVVIAYIFALKVKVICFTKEDKAIFCLLIIPWIVTAIQGMQPPARIWLFLALPFWWMLGRVASSMHRYGAGLLVVFTAAALWLQLDYALSFSNRWQSYFALNKAIEAIPRQAGCVETYDDWIYTTLLYKKHAEQKAWQLGYPPQKPPCPVPAFYLVFRRANDKVATRSRLVYANALFAVYEKN